MGETPPRKSFLPFQKYYWKMMGEKDIGGGKQNGGAMFLKALLNKELQIPLKLWVLGLQRSIQPANPTKPLSHPRNSFLEKMNHESTPEDNRHAGTPEA